MRWELLYGKDREWLESLPEDAPARRDEPDLWPENALYLRAFYHLLGSRNFGMGSINYIPYCEIEAWGRMNGVHDLAFLGVAVRSLDAIYIEWLQREQKRHGA